MSPSLAPYIVPSLRQLGGGVHDEAFGAWGRGGWGWGVKIEHRTMGAGAGDRNTPPPFLPPYLSLSHRPGPGRGAQTRCAGRACVGRRGAPSQKRDGMKKVCVCVDTTLSLCTPCAPPLSPQARRHGDQRRRPAARPAVAVRGKKGERARRPPPPRRRSAGRRIGGACPPPLTRPLLPLLPPLVCVCVCVCVCVRASEGVSN